MKLEDVIGSNLTKVRREENLLALNFANGLRLEICALPMDAELMIDMVQTRMVEEIINRETV